MIKLSALVFQHSSESFSVRTVKVKVKDRLLPMDCLSATVKEVCCLTRAYSASAMDTTLFPLNSSVR